MTHEERRIERVIVGALKQTQTAHGPITSSWNGSAAKRIRRHLQGAGLIATKENSMSQNTSEIEVPRKSEYQVKQEWTANLVRDYFGQDEYWIDSKGKRNLISQMPKPYALNALLYIERVREQVLTLIGDDVELNRTVLYLALKNRVVEDESAKRAAELSFTR